MYRTRNMQKTNVLIDAHNLLYRTFFGNIKDKESEDIIFGLCYQAAIITMNKYYKQYNPDRLIMFFDHSSWRKVYTNSDECVSHLQYKGNRRQKLSTSQKEKLEIFDEHIDEFYEILKNKTNIITVKEKYLEADDLIAFFVQKYETDENYIISSDKDYMQLITNNTKVVDPFTDTFRTLKEYSDDPEFFMMFKCFRGDKSDNVQSAYPRLYKTKMIDAYGDEYKLNNLLENEFTVPVMEDGGNVREVKYKTKDLYKENELLMSLTAQPEGIRELGMSALERDMDMEKSFDYYKLMRFCAKNDMVRLVENFDKYKNMLGGV